MSNLDTPKIEVVSENAARPTIEPHFDAFRKIIEESWNTWAELGQKAPQLKAPLSAHCRARFIYDHIVFRARAHFDGKKGVKIHEKHGFLILNIDDKLTIRFKKLDDKRRTSNIPTRQQVLFSMQLEMPGMPSASRLVAGYQLDQLQLSIKEIAITCPVGRKVEWFISISESAPNVTPIETTAVDLQPAILKSTKPATKAQKSNGA